MSTVLEESLSEEDVVPLSRLEVAWRFLLFIYLFIEIYLYRVAYSAAPCGIKNKVNMWPNFRGGIRQANS